MRAVAIAAACWLMGPWAFGQPLSASGGIGVGIIADSPASTVQAGVDASWADVQIGIGGRLTLLADGSLRTEDWDSASEWATVLRYFLYRRPAFDDEWQLSIAAGTLERADVGYGALVSDYASGIDIDHGRLGVQARTVTDRFGGEILVDDVVAPRILGARASVRSIDTLHIGVGLVSDVSAPSMNGTEVLVGSSVDAVYSLRRMGRPWWMEGFAEVATWWQLGLGATLGARGALELGGVELRARGELRLSSDRYLHGHIGPLYERHRHQLAMGTTLLDRVRAGGLGGIGGATHLGASRAGLGAVDAWFAHRPGLGAQLGGRLTMATFEAAQFAATAVHEQLGADPAAWVAASELRVRLPARLHGELQLARLIRRDREVESAWWVLATLGARLGD